MEAIPVLKHRRAFLLFQQERQTHKGGPQYPLLQHPDIFLIFRFFPLAYLKIYMLYNVYFKFNLTTYCMTKAGCAIVSEIEGKA